MRWLKQLRYFRGRAIHSPFVFQLKREVFMGRKKHTGSESELTRRLTQERIGRRRVEEIARLERVFDDFSIECFLPGESAERLQNSITTLREDRQPICIIIFKSGKQIDNRSDICGKEIESGEWLSVDRAKYLLLFKREGLTPQHFIL